MSKWDQLARPPAEALKQIKGGRLAGKTDINPQWRYRAMHDVYGACGEGWRYQIERIWTEPGLNGQVFQFVQISVFVRTDAGEWSEPIPGVGGSMLIEEERGGPHHNDEAVKMAVTDALSTALKMLGVAADIYAGLWDGAKYRQPATKTPITPNVDAGEGVPGERKNILMDMSIAITDYVKSGDFIGAYQIYEEAQEQPEKLYLWSLLNSMTRRAIKEHGALLRDRETEKKETEDD